MTVFPDRDTTGTKRDIIDPSGKLLIRILPGGAKTYYVYGLGLLYEVDEAETTKTYHFNQVGSTIARTDDSGKVIGRAEYSAYGLITLKEGDMATPFLYNGQAGVQTEPNGLLNMRARYYSPYLMRFLNADPSGFSGGCNWFAYADGNPVSLSDPFGLCAQEVRCTSGQTYGSGSVPYPGWMQSAISGMDSIWSKLNPPVPEGMVILDMGIAGLFTPIGGWAAGAEALAAANSGSRTVSRWMSQAEYDAMVNAGRVLPDSAGGKYILNEAAGSAIPGAVRPGAVHAQFEIPAGSRSAVTDPSKGWEFLYTDKTVRGRLDATRGTPAPPDLPTITNPRIIGGN